MGIRLRKSHRKERKKKTEHEDQFSINQMMKDKIEKIF
jgi:hypothetical protein